MVSFLPTPAEIHHICIKFPTCKCLPSVKREKDLQSHRRGFCSVIDGYPVFLDTPSIRKLWNRQSIKNSIQQCDGMRQKLASEPFGWNIINKDWWVLVAKTDQHSEVSQQAEESVWNLWSEGILHLLWCKLFILSWVCQYDLVLWACYRSRATCTTSRMYS